MTWEGGDDVGRGAWLWDNKKYCTYNTFLLLSLSLIYSLHWFAHPLLLFLYLIAYPINIPFPAAPNSRTQWRDRYSFTCE